MVLVYEADCEVFEVLLKLGFIKPNRHLVVIVVVGLQESQSQWLIFVLVLPPRQDKRTVH